MRSLASLLVMAQAITARDTPWIIEYHVSNCLTEVKVPRRKVERKGMSLFPGVTYASTAEGNLGWNVNIGSVYVNMSATLVSCGGKCSLTLVFSQQGDVQKNGERSGISGEHHNFSSSAVQGLGGLVGALLQLAVVGCRLDQVQNFLAHRRISDGPSGRVVLVRHADG